MKNLLIRMPLREKPLHLHSMRKNHTFFYRAMLPAVILSLLLTACRKDDDGPKITPPPPTDYTVLPPITQEGKNTFGCLVDGEVWVPRVEVFTPLTDKSATLHESNGKGNGVINALILSPTINNNLTMGFSPTYFMLGSQKITAIFRDNYGNGYRTIDGDTMSNRITFTRIDTGLNLISGTFQLKLISSETQNSIINITQGRFDMPYYPE